MKGRHVQGHKVITNTSAMQVYLCPAIFSHPAGTTYLVNLAAASSVSESPGKFCSIGPALLWLVGRTLLLMWRWLWSGSPLHCQSLGTVHNTDLLAPFFYNSILVRNKHWLSWSVRLMTLIVYGLPPLYVRPSYDPRCPQQEGDNPSAGYHDSSPTRCAVGHVGQRSGDW